MLLKRAALVVTAFFTAVPASFPQIVINEILQNPEFVGDTDGEWVELFNAGIESIDIDGWTIHDDGTNSHVINNGGPLIVDPGHFIVLGRNADPALNGNVPVSYEYGSSMTLGNGSDQVVLDDPDGNEIDRVGYDDGATFPDPSGASMELIHFSLDNSLGQHWLEALTSWSNGDKGTPGAANSRLDTVPPVMTSVSALEPTVLTVVFSEVLDPENATKTAHYFITPEIGFPMEAIIDSSDHSIVRLIVHPIQGGTRYILTATGISDPVGNSSGPDSASFQLAEPILPGDIIITEIMKDPTAVSDSDGEWFEVYNASAQSVDLFGWEITDGGSNTFTVQSSMVLPPGEFGLFVINADSATNGGLGAALAYDWGSSGTFTLGNGEDKIILSLGGVTIDSVSYDAGAVWPDPSGSSMGLSEFTLDNNNGGNWTPAVLREPAYIGSQGDLGSPGTFGSNQYPGSFPAILLSSDSLSFSILPGGEVIDSLTISNTGTADLEWSVTLDDTACSWLSVQPTSGTIAPAGENLILVSVSGSGLQSGIYLCGITVFSNDPTDPVITIPVTLEVRDTLVSGSILIPDKFLPIPPGGAAVEMSVVIRNPGTLMLSTEVWITLARPGFPTPKEVIAPRRITLAAGDSLLKIRNLEIPSYGPAGVYELSLKIGSYPDSIRASASFRFEKSQPASQVPDEVTSSALIPKDNYVNQSFPNPFNPSATITYGLKEETWVTIAVYDLLGREVAGLLDAYQAAGRYSVTWEGRSSGGVALSSGVYLYRIRAGEFTDSGRMILMK